MSAESNISSLLKGVVRDVRSSWRSLVLTDIAFKALAFIVLTPLVGVLFRALLAAAGSAVVSDADILYFFLGPLGWVCIVVVGPLWLGIIALEQATLTGAICGHCRGKPLGPVAALRFAAAKAWPVMGVTMRMVVFAVVAIVPFLVAAAVVYLALLTEYDINYYLTEKPPVFKWAVGIGVAIVVLMVALLLRLFTSWFFALPLVLFEDIRPRHALRLSAARAHGHRRMLLGWLVGWALAITVLSAVASGLVVLVGRALAPESTDSLRLLAVVLGLMLLVGAVVNLAVNLLSTVAFAAILFNLYRGLGRDGVTGTPSADFPEASGGGSSFKITRARLIAAVACGVVAAVAVDCLALRSVRLVDDVKIMAHRGSSKAAPENTLAAFRRAVEDGADWIELDVQETADGEIVVFHDNDFMKLAGRDLRIWEAALADVQDIDIGSSFDPEFKDQRVPTLGEVLDECQGKIRVNIELKYYGHDQQLEQRVADIVEAHEMSSDVILMSLKMDGVKKMKSIRPNWKVGLLMSVSAGNLNKIEADFLAVNVRFVNRSLIRTAHRSGKEIYVWTVDDAPTMSTMISQGVDGILTNKPALARSVLAQRARMSVPERLLLEFSGALGLVPEVGEQ
ncbi:MAG TPA: glycerophosphodiester phosphodiesterase [Pirellulaceae bacterium]|nr:glycerophosphodiester phosphodiesterase [Pirellulaceae bacterium]